MARLSSLRLEALRGASQPFELKFESSKSVVIIYGENGSGKSTICDGFDLLCNGNVGSLEGKGLGAATARFWHSTNRKATDIRITLASRAGKWTGQIAKGGKLTVSPADGRPKVSILRRHQILDLLTARPGDRYEAVRPFIAIEGIDESERTLRDLMNVVERQQGFAAARIGENLQSIENIWRQVGSPGPSTFEWAEAEAKRDTTDLDQTINLIRNVISRKNALVSRMQDSEQAGVQIEDATLMLNKAEESLNKELQNVVAGGEELTQLLQGARHFFQHHGQPDACPLCGSKEFADGLPKTVEDKLNSLSALQSALGNKAKAQKALDLATAHGQTVRKQLSTVADEMWSTCSGVWPTDLPQPTPITQIHAEPAAPDADSDWPPELIQKLSAEATKLGDALDPELNRRTQRRSLLQTLRDSLKQYRHNQQQKGELDALLPRLKNAHKALVEERHSFVDQILRRIATHVGELYEEVHPGEGLSKISLQLDPDRRASLDVVSQFPGAKDPPPGAYLSESHLDTLGLCIFIALVELDAPAETVLVLDDVIASVDEPHVDRIIEMIYNVSERFAHCVLTTHYMPWREKFRWGWLKNGECQLIELGDWSLENGVVSSKSTPRVEVLRGLLAVAKPDAQVVSACAGVVLEAVLDFLTRTYECAVPRRRTKPTLGDLLPAMNKKLRAALRVEIHDAPVTAGVAAPAVLIGEVLTQIEEFAGLRNIIGCHFNEIAFQLQDASGIEFGRMVLELADALLHPEHGWPASDKSGEYLDQWEKVPSPVPPQTTGLSMTQRKQKLELTWIGKENRPRLEPRILFEDPENSYHAQHRVTDDDIFDNRLIFGDNLLALKALEQEFAGKIKCIYIDPPYNTGAAFTHYDDGVEHSIWLSLMRDRIELMRRLLTPDGSLWITIDDNEAHYLKVSCDEIFGRQSFVSTVIWEKADSPRNSARQFSVDHDYILVFSKSPDWIPKRLERTEEANSIYANPDDDPRGPWIPGDPYANKPYSRGQYTIRGPTGRAFSPPPGRFWRISEEKLRELDKDGRIWWGPKGDARPSIKRYLSEVSDLVPRTLWSKEEVGSNRTSKNEMRDLFPDSPSFGTPKPERLVERILKLSTNPGDWVLGGFRYYRLAPSLLGRDKWGNWVISKEFNPAMLAQAACKLEGFTYAPSDTLYWQHGHSTERDFIYVTTQNLNADQLAQLSDEVGSERSLLVLCAAFRGKADRFPNLTVKKIPKAVLTRCEWGHDDYSLQVDNLPKAPPEPGQQEMELV